MARRKGTQVENNFVGGLVTEKTALAFPPNACTETFNCVFDAKGIVTRRPGIDLEEGFQRNTVSNDYTTVEAYTEYLWRAAGGDGDNNLLVVQKGNTLYFYDVGDTVEATTTNLLATTIMLSDYLPSTPAGDPATTPCQYASGNGVLIVTNRYTDPFYVVYDATDDSLTGNQITVKYRDFIGLDDGLDLTERPAYETTAALTEGNAEHYYNIINQGWHQQGTTPSTDNALEQWATARTDMPSNADYIGLYRASATDSFDNARVLSISPGNTPAPKGHFILNLGEGDREGALLDEGLGLSSLFSGGSNISGSVYENTSGVPSTASWSGVANAFDGETSETAANSATVQATTNTNNQSSFIAYIGKTLSSPSKVLKSVVYGSTDLGYVRAFNASGGGLSETVTLRLYAKQGSAPTSPTDGTALSDALSFSNPSNGSTGKVLTNTLDTETQWDHTWITITMNDLNAGGNSQVNYYIAESQFFIKPATTGSLFIPDATSERPECVTFYAGRAWYAGINEARFNNTLYYTQIIEQEDQYDKCHQANDPTAETYFDLLPNDGGTIRIPDCGGIQKIFVYYGGLIVLALNGTWVIRGSGQGQGFTAVDYRVEKISSLGTQSPMSVVDVRGIPMWWGEDSIFKLNYNPQFDSYSIDSVTDETIKEFYLAIPANNRQYAKGTFDVNGQVVTWLYNNSETLDAEDVYTYNAALSLHITSNAFYPWTFLNTNDAYPLIRGIVYAIDGGGVSTPRTKFVVTWPSTQDEVDDDVANEDVLGFAEYDYTNWYDWTDYTGTPEGTSLEPIDNPAYFITGYRWDGEASKFFQSNYVQVFLEQQDNAQAYVQAVWDTTNSGNSGKWSTRQAVYNDTLTNRNVNWRRLKIRGKGRSLQFRFTSAPGQPFSIIGWSVFQTANADI